MVTPGQINRRAELYHQLGASLSAGIPLIRALEMTGQKQSLNASEKALVQLVPFLKEGHTLTDSMQLVQEKSPVPGMDVTLKARSHKPPMPEFDMALLSVGEETGRLDVIFKLLSVHYATRAQIIRDTISGLLHPLLNLHVFFLVMPLQFLIMFAMGFMNNEYALCLPFIIEKIIVFGVFYGLIFFFIFACQGTRGENWRAMVESITRLIPMLRMALKYLAVARLTAALEALTNAGVPAIKSWELAARTSGSPRLKREILKWLPHLESGVTPSEMVNQIGYFPELFANLYHTGEISGKMDDTLTRLRNYYQEEGFRKMKLFTRIMNGIIYGVIALSIAYFVIKFYVGYFNAALNV